MKVVVLVLSNKQEHWGIIEKKGIRETWGKDPKCKVIYYYGGCAEKVEGDRWFFDVPESNDNISVKTLKALQKLLKEEEFDYVFRTNTSSYVDTNYLEELCEKLDREKILHAGVIKKFGPAPEHGTFASGAGIMLARAAVEFIVGNSDKVWDDGLTDDRAIGYCLSHDWGRFKLHSLPRLDVCDPFGRELYNYEKSCIEHFHVRCKNPFNPLDSIEYMKKIHQAKKQHKIKKYPEDVFNDKYIKKHKVCFLINKKENYSGSLVEHRWRKLSRTLINLGHEACLRSSTPPTAMEGNLAIGKYLDGLLKFDTVVFTYPVPETPALLQYLNQGGVKTIIDVTNYEYDFSFLHNSLNRLSALVTGSKAEYYELKNKLRVNCEYLGDFSRDVGPLPSNSSKDIVNVMYIGMDKDYSRISTYLNYTLGNVQLISITGGKMGTHPKDYNLFKDMGSIDAVIVPNSISLPIPPELIKDKGVPILAERGRNSENNFGKTALYCHSDDEWQRAFSRMTDPDWLNYLKRKTRVENAETAHLGVLLNSKYSSMYRRPNHAQKINMIIRTSRREKFFGRLMECLENQDYPNLRVIVSADNQETAEYVKKHKIVDTVVLVKPKDCTHYYNEYMNPLLEEVEDGWVFYMDDDDLLFDNETLWSISSSLRDKESINVFQMVNEKDNKLTLPPWEMGKEGVSLNHIGTPCFIMDTKIAKLSKWLPMRAADGNYILSILRKIGDHKVVRHDLVTVRLPDGANRGKTLGDP